MTGSGAGRIVVGVDGTHASDAALAWAVAEGRTRGADVQAVHVLVVPPEVGIRPWPDPTLNPVLLEGERLLAESLARVDHEAGPDVRSTLLEGLPAPALLTAAQGADLLVLGKHGRGPEDLRLGSTAYHCLHHSSCPVVLLHQAREEVAAHAPVVAGVDGSPSSATALGWAISEAALRRVKVEAILVWEDPYTVVGPPPPVWVAGKHLSELEHLLDSTVEHAMDAAGEAAVAVSAEVRSGHPAEVLAEAAHHAGLLVVGSRRQSPVAAALRGSVGLRCAQTAACPVAVVPIR